MPAGGLGAEAALKMLPGIMGSSGGGGKSGGGTPGMGGGSGGGLPVMDAAKGLGGSALSLGTGLIQNIQANKLKKEANASVPPLVDPDQAAFLSELHQKRKSIETGADFSAGMNALDASNAGTNEAILRNSGGDVSGTIQALLQSQRGTNDAKNNLLAQGAGEQMQYNSMYGDFLNKIAARKMQLQMYKSQQARAEWAQKQQNANQNTMAGLAGFVGGADKQQSGNAGQQQQSGGVNTDVLQSMLGKTAGLGGSGMTAPGEGVEGVTNAAAGMA